MKILETKIRKFNRNEDHSMPISRNTNVRVFPKTIACGPRTFQFSPNLSLSTNFS